MLKGTSREIVKYPHPALLKPSDEVTVFDEALKELALDLFATGASVEWGRAVGMAAPQIGVNKRVFIAFNQIFVNPVITAKSTETRKQREGCYSLKDKKFDYEVQRYRWVFIKWQDLNGKAYRKRFSRAEAQVIQHLMDHLDGVLCLK